MADNPEPVSMEEVTDPEALAAIRARRARCARHAAWVQAYAAEVWAKPGSESNGIKLSSNASLINELRSSRCHRVPVSQIGSAFDGAG